MIARPAILVVGLAASTACAAPAGYKLVWSDEFEGHSLDTVKWEYRNLGDRDGAQVSRDAVSLDGKGHVVLTTFMRNALLHVGMIGTQRTFQARYGYFEARIRFQKLQGHHGAFWLQSPQYGKYLDDPGRSGAEIDVIEYFGAGRSDGGAALNIYWNPYSKPDRRGMKLSVSRPHEEFHVYAVDWTPTGYQFFVDGKPVHFTREGLSHACQYMILSLLSSPWERRRLSIAALPDAMLVDYVRVYADPARGRACPAASN